MAEKASSRERTTCRIAEAGRAELKDSLRELLSRPEAEVRQVEAALGNARSCRPTS